MDKVVIPKYSLGEEITNSVTHGIGALLSIAALVLVIVFSTSYGALAIVASCIYGISLIILYVVSTVYHALKPNKGKKVMRIIDHCSIYFLIAGTYAPFTLIAMDLRVGIPLFVIIFGGAIAGIVLTAIDLEKYSKVSVFIYLLMGWAVVFTFKPLLQALDINGIYLLIAGGLSYSLGVLFYVFGHKLKYMHSVFHVFVLAGSVLHFLAIILYVLN